MLVGSRWKVPPPSPVALPPLRVWMFISLTGQIINRQVVVEGESSEPAVSTASAGSPPPKAVTPVKKVKNPVGVGSPAGTQPPTVPNPVGEVVAGGAKASLEEEGEEAGDAEEDDQEGVADEDDLEAELKKLESMSGKKNKGKGGSKLKPKRPEKAA